MTQYIDKSTLVAEIERRIDKNNEKAASYPCSSEHDYLCRVKENVYKDLLSFLDSLEVKEDDLYNNGWIDCTKQMPPETKQTSDTLQGHREWTESDMVLVWDSMYGCGVDATKNGKWISERRGGYTGQVVHGIIAWRAVPEFSEELLLKAQKGE